jgi:heterodisulfide reductase subunit B
MLAVELAARNLEINDQVGLDLLVPCSACFQRLKVAHKKLLNGEKTNEVSHSYKGNFSIKHSVDFFWEDVGKETLIEKVRQPLTGLNPVCYYGCLTARPPRVTDAINHDDPQAMDELLRTLGANVKEWSYKTDCCGGNLILTRPDIAKILIKKLFDMAEEAGADCVVVGCPLCQSNLDSRQKEISRETGREYHIPVFYFTELMGLAFSPPPVEKWLRRHITDPRPLLKKKELI